MLEALRSWVLGLVGAGIITSICMTITPDGKVKKVVSLVCSLLIILMMINPVIGFDYGSFAQNYAQFRAEAAAITRESAEFNEKLTGLIIAEACSAYILDKGTELGIHDLSVDVSVRLRDDGYWYPYAARLRTAADKQLRDRLGVIIETDLGIPQEELIWSMNDEG